MPTVPSGSANYLSCLSFGQGQVNVDAASRRIASVSHPIAFVNCATACCTTRRSPRLKTDSGAFAWLERLIASLAKRASMPRLQSKSPCECGHSQGDRGSDVGFARDNRAAAALVVVVQREFE